MDANGELMYQVPYPDREFTVSGFEKAGEKAREFVALKKKADGGDHDAKLKILTSWLEWGAVSIKKAKTLKSGIHDLTKEESEKLDKAFTALEVKQIISSTTRDRKTWVAAGKKFYALSKDNRVPTDHGTAFSFWYLIIIYAEDEKDIKAFETGLKAFKDEFGDGPRNKRFIEKWEKTLEELKAEGSDGEDK